MSIKPCPLPLAQLLMHFAIDPTSSTGLRRLAWSSSNAKAGDEAGTYHAKTGYFVTYFRGHRYANSRIVYALAYGVDPGELHVDHIDRNKRNNDPSNLRIVTNRVNQQNREKETGLPVGVWHDKRRNRYVAKTRINGKQVQIGRFTCPSDAGRAYAEATAAIAAELDPGDGVEVGE